MELTINVLDYLSEEDIREECRRAVRQAVLTKYNSEADVNRLLTNAGYDFIFEAINNETHIDCIAKIKETVAKLATDKSAISFELFRKKDAWQTEEGIGQLILKSALKENEPLIKEKVKEAINEYDFLARRDLQTRMEDLFHEMLEEKMFGTKEEA